MLTGSIGDQARVIAMRSNTARLRSVLHVLTQEIASGEVADLGRRLQGNSGILNDIETRLTLTEQYQRNVKDAVIQANEQQQALGVVHDVTSKLATTILTTSVPVNPRALDTYAAEAAQAFMTVVSRLNLEYGGQYLFSGVAIDQPPLISAEEFLDRLEELTEGLTSADEVCHAVFDWFDAPSGSGGFSDVAYKGTLDDVRRFKVSGSRYLELGASAADPAIRNLLKGVALAAWAGRGIAEDQSDKKLAIMRRGAEVVSGNQDALVAYMARIGLRQKSLERQDVENTASLSILQKTRNDIRQVDPYETSVALTETESQLEILYTLTARLSKLNLTEYLR